MSPRDRSDRIVQEPAFKAACAEQARIRELLGRLDGKLLRLGMQAHREPGNWGIHGDLAHIRERLEALVGGEEGGEARGARPPSRRHCGATGS